MDLNAPQSEPHPTTALLRLIVAALFKTIGSWRIEPVQCGVAYQRIRKALGRIERMLGRFRVGKPVVFIRKVTTRAVPGTRNPSVRLPRNFGWLLEAGTHQAAYVRLKVEDLLAQPDVTALIEASPEARKLLRPFCRSLAFDLPWMIPPPRPRKPRKPRIARPKPEPYRTKLPRGVVTWARREKALEKAIERRGEIAVEMLRNVNNSDAIPSRSHPTNWGRVLMR